MLSDTLEICTSRAIGAGCGSNQTGQRQPGGRNNRSQTCRSDNKAAEYIALDALNLAPDVGQLNFAKLMF